MRFLPPAASLIVCMTAAPLLAGETPSANDSAFFESKIRPVLVEHCYECHAADSQPARGGLQLDTRAGIRRGGASGPAVVPGDPQASLILSALRHDLFEMPPEQRLADSVVADFEAWIRRGAPDPRDGSVEPPRETGIDLQAGRQFWAYQPVETPQPPPVEHVGWAHSDIDRFILARLEAEGLAPSADADRRTLIRRVYFDLVGLPPTPAEVQAFVRDRSGEALERLVTRLLNSPHFGERWGRHWLDVARFAESSGGGRTRLFPNAWRYRDYVIRSFNKDKPYDQFVMEQIAGDLMPSDSWRERAERLAALGFLTLGPTNYELQDKELLRMEVIDEQIDTIGKAFLGQTIGCARCHDHKFDPIPTRDYYALAGIFRSTKTLTPGNVSGWVTRELPLPPDEQRARERYLKQRQPLEKKRAALKKRLDELGGGSAGTRSVESLTGVVVDEAHAKLSGDWKSSRSVPSYVGDGYHHSAARDAEAVFTASLPAGRYELRLAYSGHGNRAADAKVLVEHAAGRSVQHIDQTQPGPIDGLFVSLGEFAFDDRRPARVRLSQGPSGGIVIADAVQFLPVESEKTTASAAQEQARRERQRQRQRLRVELEEIQRKLAALNRQAPEPPGQVMAVREQPEPGDYHVCIRGNAHNLGEKVPRGFLSVISGEASAEIPPGQSGRLQLARWIASDENPLTARVFVNRVWQHLLGEGLVRTPDMFGTTGRRPTHPALLDHLASEFMASGWSIKQLIRRIMLSRVYQLDSSASPAAARLDPENKWLSHANHRRLSAEAIRDAMLSVSGGLDPRPFGPGIQAGTRTELGYDFASTRRSIYVPAFRNTLLDGFAVFDMANANLVTGRRSTSAVPTQALYLMNSPFVMDQAQQFAARVLSESAGGDLTRRVDTAYRMALGRPPTQRERHQAERYLRVALRAAEPGSAGTASPEKESGGERIAGKRAVDPARLAAWTGLCHSLLACIDFRYLE